MTTDTIKAIQKQIIVKLEAGEDVSELTRRLAQERAKIAAKTEVDQLKQIADERQALRDSATKVQEKVKLQSDAIDQFLELRDTLVSQLQPLIEPMKELAKMAAPSWEREPGTCYSGFNDLSQFAGEVRGIPERYLPADFGCPFLEMEGGQVDALNKASEAFAYFTAVVGILTGFTKGISAIGLKRVEGLMAIDETETESADCIVCSHAEVETINNLLSQAKSLRDIESEFDVSRSSLSRHKQHII